MNNLDKQYTDLLQTILDYGVEKKDRTGTGTKSIFGYTIRHNMKDGFPLLTTKRLHWKSIVGELLWFLKGSTDIRDLWKDSISIWDGDWFKKYETSCSSPYTLEEIKQKVKTGGHSFHDSMFNLGPVYGKQWRRWTKKKMYLSTDGSYEKIFDEMDQTVIDQIAILINDLKTNPDSRRLMVNAWNVGELDQMTLPPCHYGFQVYTRELRTPERMDWLNKMNNSDQRYRNVTMDELNVPTRAISLMWNQRSVDTFLGLPFNIASYGLLLEIIAKAVNMVPDQLIGNLGDTHLYLDHIEQAKEQIGRELRIDERVCMCYENPKLDLARIQEGMSDDEFKSVCDEFNIPTRTRVPYPLPKLIINDEFWNPDDSLIGQIEHIKIGDFDIRDYQSHPTIKAPLSN